MFKLPAMMLYPNDWEGDEIAYCSLAAQGLWLRMMFFMHRSTRYGYLALPNGAAIPPLVVAARCGITEEAYLTLLSELDSVGKLGRTSEGVIFSRRMVRDEQKRAGDRKRKEKERSGKRDVTPHVTQVVTPLSGGITTSTSSAKEKKQKAAFELPGWIDREAWSSYEEMRVKIRKPMTDKARHLAVLELSKLGDQGHNPTDLLNLAVLNSWQGIYPPRQNGGANGNRAQQRVSGNREALRVADAADGWQEALGGHGGGPTGFGERGDAGDLRQGSGVVPGGGRERGGSGNFIEATP